MAKPSEAHVDEEYNRSTSELLDVQLKAEGLDDPLSKKAKTERIRLLNEYKGELFKRLESRIEVYAKLVATLEGVIAKARGDRSVRLVRGLRGIVDESKKWLL